MKPEYIHETIFYLKGKIGINEAFKVQTQLEQGYTYTRQQELLFWQIYIYSRRRVVSRNIFMALGLTLLVFLAFFFYPFKCKSFSIDNNWLGFLFVCWIGIGLLAWGITQYYFSRLFQADYFSGLQGAHFMRKVLTLANIKQKEDEPKTVKSESEKPKSENSETDSPAAK